MYQWQHYKVATLTIRKSGKTVNYKNPELFSKIANKIS